ncbi:MAG: DNA mismatch repair endonuclease MutL [Deltaproteobacteria bacterium]|nr:DNA mismatch repair endonuclease MutL [Deltaproteobacteria bacterium]
MPPQRVHVLPDEIANRIAAGEVVERPASVLKELVENSVDAGATKVSIQLEGAGKRLLVVEDDGHGMARQDAVLALERHATSKIACAEDLDRIATLGFRGEALPSIASVSRFSLATRCSEDAEGTRVRAEGGKLLGVDSIGAPRGTRVEVKDLFFNTPARLKFLKSDATELRRAVETLTLLALVHAGVGFELRSSGRVLLALASGLELEERTAELLGAEFPDGIVWKGFEAEGGSLRIGLGASSSATPRNGIRLFVNRRPVQDRLLFRAVMDGAKALGDGAREPRALLWLELPPDQVDVNVHPAKREVRFAEEARIFRWVMGCAAEAAAAAPVARLHPARWPSEPSPERGAAASASAGPIARVAEAMGAYARRVGGVSPLPPRSQAERFPAGVVERSRPAEQPLPASPPKRLVSLGSFDATYLLFEDLETHELVVVDQHAAHERALYDALLGGEAQGGRSQPLLFPVVLECTPAEMAAFEELRPEVEALGFRAEPFGQASVAVTEAPAAVPPGAVEAMLREILRAEAPLPADGVAAARREALAARAACSGAVKARRALVASEVEALLAGLEAIRGPATCPHGRPAALRLSRWELEKLFKRK